MSATTSCPECGIGVPTDAPLGLCPRCLLRNSASATAAYRPVEKPDVSVADVPSISCSELLRVIRELDLVAVEEIDRYASASGDDPGRLAHLLVQAKKLTPYQAGALLQGKARGLLIGRYLVEGKLGVGGMGVVFKARHRPSERVVALKILPPSFGREAEPVRRFRREFQIASRLSHPNLVAAIEASEDRGVHYLTMEYIPGYDLDRLVSQGGPMALTLALHCAIHVARGLEAAHAQGVVHRDIKPGNIMIDPAGAVRVLDLGLARVIEATSDFGRTSDGTLTQSGSTMGTVDFLAPEQADNAKAADARADIYSLGCTLYYLLTGKAPFRGETILKRLMAHQERPAPSLRAVRPEVSEALEEIYLRMMAKRPADRPQSMSEVVIALEACRTSAREAGDASADLTAFARTVMKRAPVRGRRGPDASVFGRTNASELTFDADLRLEDLVGDYREETRQGPLPEEKLPPIVSRPLPKRVRRRSSVPYRSMALALAGLALAGYVFWPRTEPVQSAPPAVVAARVPAPPPIAGPAPARTGRVLYVDEFNDPASGWPHLTADKRSRKADEYHGYVNGLYCLDANKGGWFSSSWPCPREAFPEFSCEVVGRIYGDKTDGYGYLDLGIDGVGHGLQVRLNTQSEVTVYLTTPNGETKNLGSRYDPAIKTAGSREFNKLVVQVRKRHAEIFVNGTRVFAPVFLGWDAIPARLSFGISCRTPNVHAEYDRIEVRELGPAEGAVDTVALAVAADQLAASGGGAFERLDERPTLVAPYRATPPAVDGVIRAGEYGPGVEVDFTAGGQFGAMFPGLKDDALTKSRDDLSARVHAAVTERSLFLACRVRDQFVDASDADRDRPYMNDSVTVFLDGDGVANDFNPRTDPDQKGSKEGFQLIADAAGHQATTAEGLTNRDWNAAAQRTDDGYVVEYEIPLTSIDVQDGPGITHAAPGARIRFGLAITDNDEDVSDQRSFAYIQATPKGQSPFFGGERAWEFRIRLAPTSP